MSRVILFGATSEIGQAILNFLPNEYREEITLVGSTIPKTGVSANSNTKFIFQDWSNLSSSQEMFSEIARVSEQDLVIISLGYASSEKEQHQIDEIKKSLEANLLWPIICLEALSSNSKLSQETRIIFISSSLVSLPLTSKSSIYTNLKKSAEEIIKKGFTAGEIKGKYLFVRPGFVPTKLNAHLKPGGFPSTPEEIAKTVIRKLESGQVNRVIHAPRRISILARISKVIPKAILKRILKNLQ